MSKIIPGILEKTWEEIDKKIIAVKDFCQYIHIDIIDGKFANNTTFLDPRPFAKYKGFINFEVHLMTDNPTLYLKPFSDAGFKRFLGHIEKMPSQEEFVEQGQLLGEVGLALNKESQVEDIKVNLNDLDLVLVMAIDAGFSGQSFIPSLADKIKKIKEKADIPVEIDGGINDKTIRLAAQKEADLFVANSFIFNSSSAKQGCDLLEEKIYS